MTINHLSLQSLTITMFPDGRLDTENTARYLGLEPKTLAMMRSNGKGPKFIKRGRVFYFKQDLDDWLNADGRLQSTTQAVKASMQR